MFQIDEPTNQLETVDMVVSQGTNPSMSGQRFSLQVHNIMRQQNSEEKDLRGSNVTHL